MMLGILIIFAVGFLTASCFLVREIAKAGMNERKGPLFKIEVGLLIAALGGFAGSLMAMINFV